MNARILLVAVSVLLSAASGQWLEETIEVGHPPSAVCYNTQDNKLYCTTGDTGVGLLVIDGASNLVADTVPIPAMGRWGRGLCYNPVGSDVYWSVATGRSETIIFAVDGSSNVVIDTAYAGLISPLCHNRTNNKLYASHGYLMITDTYVAMYDCATLEWVKDIYAGDQSVGQVLCYNPTDNKVYVSVYGVDNYLMIIDGVGDSLLDALPSVSGGRCACHNPQLGVVYIGRDSSVCVVDGTGDSLLGTISVPGLTLCCDSSYDKLYCAGGGTSVTVTDCAADTLLTTINVGRPVSALFCDSSYNNVYCISQDSNDVTVIDCSADTVLVTIGVGQAPSAFCCNPQHDRIYVANAGDSTIAVINAGPDTTTAVEEEVVGRPAQWQGLSARGVFHLGGQLPGELLDVSGRRIMDLKPGDNDIRHVAPGVYFVRQKEAGHTAKVVVQR